MNYIGILYTFLIFLVCFIVVHVFALAKIGFNSLKKAPDQNKTEQPNLKKERAQQPVYYLVEKKRAHKKNYSKPKEIQFK